MMQWGSPGAQYTQGNRLTRLMSGPEMQHLNDGTIAGGLAYALSRGFQAHQQARDQRMQQAADQAFTQGLAGGDLTGAIQALQGMQDNPYAQGRLTQALLAQSGQQREQAQQEAQWAREDERFGQRMAAQDQQWQQRFAAEQAARTQQAEADRAFRERMVSLQAQNRRPAAADQRIARIQAATGVDWQTASQIADGVLSVANDPVYGTPLLVNRATGQATRIQTQAPGTQVAQGSAPPPDETGAMVPEYMRPGATGAPMPQQQPDTLWQSRGGVPGVSGFLTEQYGRIAGQTGVPMGPETRETIGNRQMFRIAQNDLIRSLSINPRFPVGEMERLRRETDLEPAIFDSPEALELRMRELDAYLRNRLTNEQSAADDPNLPVTTRQAAAQAAKDIGNFLDLMGVPQGAGQAPATAAPSAPAVGTVEDGYRFLGGNPADPNSWQAVQ